MALRAALLDGSRLNLCYFLVLDLIYLFIISHFSAQGFIHSKIWGVCLVYLKTEEGP